MPLTEVQQKECATLRALFDKKAGMSQKEFAKRYDLGTPGNLNQYLVGRRAMTVDSAMRFAAALGVKVRDFSPRLADIIDACAEPNAEPIKMRMKKVPIISEAQAGLPTETFPREYEEALASDDVIYVDGELPDGTFAVRLSGDSMEPQFVKGDIIVINPLLKPRPGDFVLAQHCEGESCEGTFKKYRVTGVDSHGREQFDLVPLNPDYPTLSGAQYELSIVGVMVEHRRKYRR